MTKLRTIPALAAALAIALLLASWGDDATPEVEVPSWAKVAPEQIAEAKKHCVPVAFENDLGMRFVLIPAGTFLMGDPEFEPWSDEVNPEALTVNQHRVTITKPYYMQITEVSNEQYLRLRPNHRIAHDESPKPGNMKKPVVWVRFDQILSFAEELSERNGRSYRLPTEAEWERACRAGGRTAFAFGDAITAAQENLDFTPEQTRFDDEGDGRADVGGLDPTPWGLYDMHGNVKEFCRDYAWAYPTSHVVDPCAVTPCVSRVVRGGAWYLQPTATSCAAFRRDFVGSEFIPRRESMVVGFRLISPLPDKAK